MAMVLYFCDSCADKRVREVKTELEQLFKKNKTDPLTCGICCGEIKLKKEPAEERSENQQELLQSDKIIDVMKTESDGLVEEIPIVAKDVSVSGEDENPESDEDTIYMPSEGEGSSDYGSDSCEELDSEGKASISAKSEAKTSEKRKGLKNTLKINDVNPKIKEMILEGSITSKQFACKFCKEEFKWNAAMMKMFSVHLSKHMEQKEFSTDLSDLMEQKEVPKPFKCSLCTSCFSGFTTLKNHTRDHTNPKYYDCPHADCDRKFKHKKSIGKHEELVHSGVVKERKAKKPRVCQICGAVVKHTSMKTHLLRHEGLKAFKCSECDKCFIDKANLARHKERHSDTKKTMCEVCGKTFVLLNELNTHRITHTDERIYQCEYCPYRAKRLGTLQSHIRNIHTQSDPNKCKCGFCGLTFLSATACTKHEKKHRGGLELAETLLKPYKCPDCGYRAKKPCYIRIHRRSHTGEKPFNCAYCQRAFAQNGQCTRHMKICKKNDASLPKLELYGQC
ncbi:uncharacterized protein [Amphiura filiformis]|uniref:uncharacterized protein isoform X2 n=1 Tax=Amphiura filiformis TaxID=82378 RepID=UPI003B2189CD